MNDLHKLYVSDFLSMIQLFEYGLGGVSFSLLYVF
jgi:hypothetical protein